MPKRELCLVGHSGWRENGSRHRGELVRSFDRGVAVVTVGVFRYRAPDGSLRSTSTRGASMFGSKKKLLSNGSQAEGVVIKTWLGRVVTTGDPVLRQSGVAEHRGIAVTRRSQQDDRVRLDSPSNESKGLQRRTIEPLRILGDKQHGRITRDLRHKVKSRHRNSIVLRGDFMRQAKGSIERGALNRGQPRHAAAHRTEELMQAPEREIRFGLYASGREHRHAPLPRSPRGIERRRARGSVIGSRNPCLVEWEDSRLMFGTARDEAPPLLGRDEEQRLLRSLLDEVAIRGQTLVLRGEPGVGKSRGLTPPWPCRR